MKPLLVIIPNYNGSEFICQTIENFHSVLTNKKVVIVDDASTDNSVDVLKKASVHLIVKTHNGGFASAVNQGLEYFLSSSHDFALISNSDVELNQENGLEIEKCLYEFDEDQRLGVIGFVESSDIGNRPRNGADISGFIFLLHRRVVEKVGFFDEIFFMYGEEQDYFRRVQESGFSIKQSGYIIKHRVEGSGTCKLNNSWLSIRNSIYLEVKRNCFMASLKKVLALFLIINGLYLRNEIKNPSVVRVKRPGIVLGNIYLLKAIWWNILRVLNEKS